MNKQKRCSSHQILNPKTNRCVSKTGIIGKRLLLTIPPKKDYRKVIITNLTEIKNFLAQNNDYYRVKAYSNVLTQLYAYQKPITSFEDFKNNIKSGDKISAKVKELIETNKIKYIDVNIQKDDIYKFKEELKDVYGVGYKKANDLIAKGITSMELLKLNQHLLNEKQKIGLYYYEDLSKRIPVSEFEKHKEILEVDLKAKGFIYEFVGSYRRGGNSMGDIDILMMENKNFNLLSFVNNMKAIGYVIEVLALGKHKFMGICKIGSNPARRVDILIAPKDEYYYSLLYFTGSADFNVGFRNYVKANFGVSLSEHGLKGLKNQKPPIIKSERDIFNYFKIPYLKPEDRKVFITPIK
jgi:DNA polymerase/3'-5' exonuclease PolX